MLWMGNQLSTDQVYVGGGGMDCTWSSAEDDGRDVTITADSCRAPFCDMSGRISLLMIESLGRSEGSSSHPSSTHSTPLPSVPEIVAPIWHASVEFLQGRRSSIVFASLTRGSLSPTHSVSLHLRTGECIADSHTNVLVLCA